MLILDPEGVLEQRGHPRPEVLGADRGVEVLADDDELVSAEARDRVRRPGRLLQPVGDLDQEQIAGPVAEVVVHELEPVEIPEDDGDGAAVPMRTSESARQAVVEERLVGKAGQRVVKREMHERFLGLLALGDVLGLDVDVLDASSWVAHEAEAHEAPDKCPVSSEESPLDGRPFDLTGHDACDEGRVPVLRVDERRGFRAHEIGLAAAEELTACRVDAQDATVEAEHGGRNCTVLETQLEPLLTETPLTHVQRDYRQGYEDSGLGNRSDGGKHRAPLAVTGPDPVVVEHSLADFDAPQDLPAVVAVDLDSQQVDEVPAERVACGPPERVLSCAVPIDDVAVCVEDDDGLA